MSGLKLGLILTPLLQQPEPSDFQKNSSGMLKQFQKIHANPLDSVIGWPATTNHQKLHHHFPILNQKTHLHWETLEKSVFLDFSITCTVLFQLLLPVLKLGEVENSKFLACSTVVAVVHNLGPV